RQILAEDQFAERIPDAHMATAGSVPTLEIPGATRVITRSGATLDRLEGVSPTAPRMPTPDRPEAVWAFAPSVPALDLSETVALAVSDVGELPRMTSPADRRELASSSLPYSERVLSGWNWTP